MKWKAVLVIRHTTCADELFFRLFYVACAMMPGPRKKPAVEQMRTESGIFGEETRSGIENFLPPYGQDVNEKVLKKPACSCGCWKKIGFSTPSCSILYTDRVSSVWVRRWVFVESVRIRCHCDAKHPVCFLFSWKLLPVNWGSKNFHEKENFCQGRKEPVMWHRHWTRWLISQYQLNCTNYTFGIQLIDSFLILATILG